MLNSQLKMWMWLKNHNRHYHNINIPLHTARVTETICPELLECCKQASSTQIGLRPTNYVPVKESSSLTGKQLSQLPVVPLQKQKTKPANMFTDNEIEELAFPWLFSIWKTWA